MVNFQYKTRGQQKPQGKQRVYFTCHPDDFEIYFEDIQKEILDQQDCAVFFLGPYTISEEIDDYELCLCEMQLLVVPITRKLLTEYNIAIDTDLPLALKNNIPILPLMQENDLDDLFNSKLGDLQYLYKHSHDPTSIPYEEKLTKYLESVLIGNDLVKKIKNEFDAYIFLSYRKKDRKHANELMRLIHSYPIYRDIAIWYDEFLIPGENFNDSISSALEKSELVALVVTPNLVNESNYILNTEYPMAQKIGKNILPVRMVSTNSWKFKRMYKGCQRPIAPNKKKLNKSLTTMLKNAAINKNINKSQHDFLIGLAYLNGIDIEVNNETALELIRSSAQQGHIPAIEKLIDMYNKGNGVKRDYQKANEWQSTLVKQLKKDYNTNPNELSAIELLASLSNLGNSYLVLQKLDSAKEVYDKMRYCSGTFCMKHENKYFFVLLQSYADIELGDIAVAQSNFSETEEWYQRSISLCEMLIETEKTSEAQRELSISYIKLGDILKKHGKLYEAEQWYYKILTIFKMLAKESETANNRRDLSRVYEKIGDNSRMQDKINKSKKWYLKSLVIDKALTEETQLVIDKRNLQVSYNKIGVILKAQGDIDEAEKYYHEGFKIATSIAEETNTIQSRRDLFASCTHMGDIAREQKKLNEAKEWYLYSLSLCKTLAKETGTIEDQQNLLTCYTGLGTISVCQDDRLKAEEWYYQALNLCKSLAKENDTIESKNNLAFSYFYFGSVSENIDMIKSALLIWQNLSSKYPDSPYYSQLAHKANHMIDLLSKNKNSINL
jgi:tetratricopeptide (TPR) repeat protein